MIERTGHFFSIDQPNTNENPLKTTCCHVEYTSIVVITYGKY